MSYLVQIALNVFLRNLSALEMLSDPSDGNEQGFSSLK